MPKQGSTGDFSETLWPLANSQTYLLGSYKKKEEDKNFVNNLSELGRGLLLIRFIHCSVIRD